VFALFFAPGSQFIYFELCDAIFSAGRDFKAETVKYEDLTLGWNHLCFMDDQAGERVGLIIR
jgi:hypothetical protein